MNAGEVFHKIASRVDVSMNDSRRFADATVVVFRAVRHINASRKERV
jgi:hypothetical protein